MRIRIRRAIAGIVDGVSLSHLEPGLSYDVTDSLGGFLVSCGDADEVPASTPVEPKDDSTDSSIFGGVIVASQFDRVDRAADRPRPIPRRRKRR